MLLSKLNEQWFKNISDEFLSFDETDPGKGVLLLSIDSEDEFGRPDKLFNEYHLVHYS